MKILLGIYMMMSNGKTYIDVEDGNYIEILLTDDQKRIVPVNTKIAITVHALPDSGGRYLVPSDLGRFFTEMA